MARTNVDGPIGGTGRTGAPARAFFLSLLAGLIALGCATIAPFNQVAYEQAISLKVESLALMDNATAPFAECRQEVRALRLKIDKAYEYARWLPKNEISARQWEVLKDSDRHLLGGFLERWRKESVLSKGYVEEKKRQVADAFDTIIGLESGKIKPAEIK